MSILTAFPFSAISLSSYSEKTLMLMPLTLWVISRWMPAHAEHTKTKKPLTTYMVPWTRQEVMARSQTVSFDGNSNLQNSETFQKVSYEWISLTSSTYLLPTVEALLVLGQLAQRVHGIALRSRFHYLLKSKQSIAVRETKTNWLFPPRTILIDLIKVKPTDSI